MKILFGLCGMTALMYFYCTRDIQSKADDVIYVIGMSAFSYLMFS